ncbi:MAG: magnesium chelatase subunit D [Burkholderiaceae bacterium]
MNEQALTQWLDAFQAACLLAIDPQSFGGIRVRAGAGPVRDYWLQCLLALWPDPPQVRRVPASVEPDRLVGGLDLPATLSSGKPVLQAGLLSELNGGLALLPMAEKLSDGAATLLGDCVERSSFAVQRDGFDLTTNTAFTVVAFDESTHDEPPPAKALTGRLALDIDLEGLSANELSAFGQPDKLAVTPKLILQAREALAQQSFVEDDALALCSVASNLGVYDSRADWFVMRAYRAAVALNEAQVGDAQSADAMSLAARLVLVPRATQLPVAQAPEPPAENESDHEQPTQDTADQSELPDSDQAGPEPSADESPNDVEQQAPGLDEQTEILLEAVMGSMPEALREALATGSVVRLRSGAASGRAQQRVAGRSRGRPAGVQRGTPGGGRRLHLTETLRAAVPWQRMRRKQAQQRVVDDTDAATGIRVMPDDFRVRRYKQRGSSLSLFVVDASGSAAMRRLGEAKGAVELLLADCYVRRDQVALIAFRGNGAQLLLSPTRSLARARRELAQLPGGGGTPLASGLKLAVGVVDQALRDGLSVSLVIMTDGQANVGLDGQGGRAQAREDAQRIARLLAARSVKSIVVDMSVRASDRAEELAKSLKGVCLSLPFADARRIDKAIRQERVTKAARG